MAFSCTHTGRAGVRSALSARLFALGLLFSLGLAAVVPARGFADDGAVASTLTWEQYRDAAGITDESSIQNTPMGSQGGFPVNVVWTVVAAILVFWMQAGFAAVEAGFTRSKNTVNIMMKNLMDFVLGSLAFWAIGFGLMFGESNGFFGTTGFFLGGYQEDPWTYAFLLFQTVFAATAATIVSGAMAERTKFVAYLIYSVVISALIYPVFGSWAWGGLFHGGGWLQAPEGGFLASKGLPPFIDFAGSTVVHSIGGWAALAGAIVLGPRLGRYDAQGQPRAIPGHSMALATLGVFILWMGWFGFNPGSTTAAVGGGDNPWGGVGKALGLIAINTNLAACAGAAVSMFVIWMKTGKPDIGMTLNGTLAGLVAITSPCATVDPWHAVIIGSMAGTAVVFACAFFDKLKIDDPVGAISVHGVCGALGTLSAGVFSHGGFSMPQLITQLIGVASAFLWTFPLAFVLFKVLKATVGLRVTPEEELEGLDLTEHGSEAYPKEASYAGADAGSIAAAAAGAPVGAST